MNDSQCIQVELCTHKVNKEDGTSVSKWRVIGSLLPVRKDEVPENTSPQCHDELFSTLNYEGAIHARKISRTVDIGLLRAWMGFCEDSHSHCKIVESDVDAKTQLRLIDVLERRPVSSNLNEKYVALSYVWGKGKNEVLKKDTFEHFQCKESLTPEAIPRIVSDAMELVAALGERYLWADIACIVQDDTHDKQRQLPIMDSIYSHAKLTIIAAVESANNPLPRWNKCHHMMPLHTELLCGTLYTTSQPNLETALEETTWSERGWTFQEGLLARRALIFTRNLVYWNCREESWCEDQYTEFHDMRQELTANTSLFATCLTEILCEGRGRAIVKELCAMGRYMQKAQSYSRRSFSNYSDIVWAFSGILKDMRDNFPRGYIWSLPYDQLDTALLWQTCCALGRCPEHQHDRGTYGPLPIPSWCWIAKGHRVWFERCCGSTVSRVTWHEPIQYTSLYDRSFDGENLAQDPQPSAFAGPESPRTESSLFDFALLHFTAQTTLLFLELDSKPDNARIFATYAKRGRAYPQGFPRVLARIHLLSGREIGQIQVPVYVFRHSIRQRREFVLLSEYTGENWHRFNENDAQHASDGYHERYMEGHNKEGCTHKPALNIMLVEWVNTRNSKAFAIRVALGRVDLSAWDEVVTTEKRIILG
jgi:hypothetical protein